VEAVCFGSRLRFELVASKFLKIPCVFGMGITPPVAKKVPNVPKHGRLPIHPLEKSDQLLCTYILLHTSVEMGRDVRRTNKLQQDLNIIDI